MVGVALRGGAVVVAGGLLLGLATPAAVADPATSTVTLAPDHGPVGTTLDITATSGLADVTQVTFTGSAAPVAPTQPASDTDVEVVVPGDAATGPLTLTFTDPSSGQTSAAQTDVPFTVQLPTSATISRSQPVIVFRSTAVISAALTAAGAPVPGQPARLQRTTPGTSDWRDVQAAQSTDSAGAVHWTVDPAASSAYRVDFPGTPSYAGTATERTRINVVPIVTLSVPSVAPILTATAVTGRVRPAPETGSAVRLRQRVDGDWHRVKTGNTDSRGRFSVTVRVPAVGHYAFVAFRPHDVDHHSALSPVGRLQAVQRALHSGMSGPDVKTLQRQLRRLHYDVPTVSGSFDYDTEHAVIAFEKVQRLDRDGVVGTQAWTALGSPRKPKLRHPQDASAAGVEVDLTRQILLYAVKGRIVRILDISSGGGYTYTGSDGTQQRAVTPTGHFSVVYKRDGWVHAPLGDLYRPAYFNTSGYAIHGETSVPSYPASHGCVRITVPAMDRLNAKLTIGLSVWIYGS